MASEFDPATDARTRILQAVRSVPRGRVVSYGQIATRVGLPGRARWVARVLAQAPSSLRLPWHRVLRADGRIGFPIGSPGHHEQTRRLRAEGVTVVNGRVRFDSGTGDGGGLDRALWGPG